MSSNSIQTETLFVFIVKQVIKGETFACRSFLFLGKSLLDSCGKCPFETHPFLERVNFEIIFDGPSPSSQKPLFVHIISHPLRNLKPVLEKSQRKNETQASTHKGFAFLGFGILDLLNSIAIKTILFHSILEFKRNAMA